MSSFKIRERMINKDLVLLTVYWTDKRTRNTLASYTKISRFEVKDPGNY